MLYFVFDDDDNEGVCVDLERYPLLEPEAGILNPVLCTWDDESCSLYYVWHDWHDIFSI